MRLSWFFSGLLSLTALAGFSQDTESEEISYCGITDVRNRVFNDFYGVRLQDSIEQAEFQQVYEDYLRSGYDQDRGQVYVIPTVFHIVHLGGAENISDFQCYDAMRILNEDFRKLNADTSAIVAQFKGIAADCEIEFRLATKDPNGNCHKGITRTYSPNTIDQGIGFGGHPIVDDIIDEHGLWPSNKYMNIIVCIDPSGAAGYTYNPGSFPTSFNSMYASIFINHTYVGSIGTGSPTRSRALTHEVGHWFNLAHPWGPNNNPGNPASCGDDDGVQDTPISVGWTTCNLNGNSCDDTNDPNNFSSWSFDVIDNVQNYMDYSYCSRMFTEGQAARMRASLATSPFRTNLWTAANLAATGVSTTPVLCGAEMAYDSDIVCAGQTITFEDRSYHSVTGRTWTFPGGSPSSSTDSVVTVTYATPGVYDVVLQVTDGSTTLTETQTGVINVLPQGAQTPPVVEGWEAGSIIPGYWFLTNPSTNAWEVTNAAAASGQYSIWIDNTQDMAGEVHEFVSSTYGLQFFDDITVSFKYAYVQRNSATQDVLKFYVSNNCGVSWSPRKTLTGSALSTDNMTGAEWIPSGPEDWEETIITNVTSFFFSPEFRMKFEFTSDGGNNLFIDDINISGTLGVIHLDADYFNLAVYPNPTDGNSTMITFNFTEQQQYTLQVLDQLGRVVTVLADGQSGIGEQRFDLAGSGLTSGLYLIRLTAGDKQITERLIVK